MDLLHQLLIEIRAAGGTTAELLNQLPPDSPLHYAINIIDSQLSVWEDDIAEAIATT